MAGDKEASVRLTLKGDGFKRGMTDAEGHAKKSAKSIGESFKSSLSEGGKAGLESLKSSLSRIKDVATGFLGIAGGIGIADLARKAMMNEGAFRKMAFAIRAGTGELVNWRDLQKEAQATALKTGHTTEDVAASMAKMRDITGDTTFARKASDVVAQVATGSHESLESITALAGGLNEKFGVTHEQLGDTLASVIALGDSGGITVEELSENINRMGAGAKQAGLQGQQGFETMVDWLKVAHGATGNLRKGISGVSGIIDGLSSGSLRMPVLQHAQIDIEAMKKSGKDFNTIIGAIIAKTGGKQERLAQIFSGDQLKVVTEIGKTYSKAFAETSGDVKTKTAAGLAAYNAALKDQAKASTSFKDLQDEAAKEMETPEKKIAVALEKLAQTFASPKMMAAFDKLADMMPKIVDAIVSHPLLTGAIVTGIPQAVAGAVLSGLMKGMIGGAGGGGMGVAGQAGTIAATAAAAYIGGRALIDMGFENVAQREASIRATATTGRNALSASRTGKFSSGEKSDQAAEADRQAAELDQRIKLALATKENLAGGDEQGGRAGGRMHARFEEAAAAALPQGSAKDRSDWINTSMATARKDADSLDELMASRDDLKQASENFKDKGFVANISAGSLPSMMGSQGPTNLLGDSGMRLGDRAGRKAALDAAKTPADTGAAQARMLADAISGRELKVRVTNPDDIGKNGEKPGGPTPGFFPR